MVDGPCDSTGSCPAIATFLRDGYLEAWIGDLSYVTDPDDRAAMRGFDLASSAEWVSTPPTLQPGTHSIVLDVANSHFEPGGADVFVGSAEFRLPFSMLTRIYDVDDPGSLTPAAFAVTAGSGSAPTVSVSVGASDVHVSLEDLTFTKRRLRIHGDVAPGRPRDLTAERTAVGTGVLRFRRALPRGAEMRGYQAVCRHRGHVERESAGSSPIRLRSLVDARYECTVRAKSKAGLGRAADVRMPRG
jgi:hypothetical protein